MKQVGFWFFVLLVVLSIAWYIRVNGVPSFNSIIKPSATTSKTQSLSIADKTIVTIEIADTDEKRALGLSFRKSLPEKNGMLFIFETPGTYSFWMKDMNFPLDMIWIGEDNTIVDITENVPNPDLSAPLYDLPHYSPKVPAKMILEVNAGFSKKNVISLGDRVEIN